MLLKISAISLLLFSSLSMTMASQLEGQRHITFKATSNNVEPTKVQEEYTKPTTKLQEMIRQNPVFDKSYDKIIQTSSIPNESTTLISYAKRGLVSAIVKAYNTHHNLVLRPDDIWQAILTQFSFYVNANAEDLRDKFVDFQGKKTLEISAYGTLFTVDFGTLAKRMVDEQITKNIKDPEVTKWLLPAFTTTTNEDRIAASVTIMSTLKAYFEYGFSLGCGIPYVTLLGTVEDWEMLRKKADGLLQYDIENKDPVMKKWHGLLSKVLDEFVKSAKGESNLEFWDKVAHYKRGGSGPSYLSGWVTVFACFNNDGEWQGDKNYRSVSGGDWPFIDTDDIPVGAVSVPVAIDDNGKEYEAMMNAGQFIYGVIGDNLDTIQPRNDWSIAIKSESDEKETKVTFADY